jgi:polyisoprenyl-phosphate glycosyltransferase
MRQLGRLTNVECLPLVSVVVPVYREGEGIFQNVGRLTAILDRHKADFLYEVVLVNDGSPDDSLQQIEKLQRDRPEVIGVVNFLRNFGQVSAILAGLARAKGDCIVVISADLQDPPELIPAMVDKWRTGNKTVLAIREARKDNWTARVPSRIFYSAMQRYAFGSLPRGGFDFYLLDRTVAERVLASPEPNSFMQGRILYASGPVVQIPYTRQNRSSGVSSWPFSKKLKYFIDGFTGYTFAPIRLMSITGISSSVVGIALSGVLAAQWIFFGIQPRGWTVILAAALILQGAQMLMTGVLGEYVWRTLDQVRNRVPYIVDYEALPNGARAGGAFEHAHDPKIVEMAAPPNGQPSALRRSSAPNNTPAASTG